VIDGLGYLFVGVSTAGKSTLARLWEGEECHVLSDDRLIVRPGHGGYEVHGTPWHGDAGAALGASAPLAGVYLLDKTAGRNVLRELSPADAVTRLLVCCFPTFYFRVGMENTLDVLTSIARNLPMYEFGFLPDVSAIDYFMENRPQ
jgi:hypothetical protein